MLQSGPSQGPDPTTLKVAGDLGSASVDTRASGYHGDSHDDPWSWQHMATARIRLLEEGKETGSILGLINTCKGL